MIKILQIIYNNYVVGTVQKERSIISYHTNASGIRKNIALLRPISNEAELYMGRRRAILFRPPRARVL